MPSHDLPSRPNLDRLKNEAKTLRTAFVAGDPAAIARVAAVLGARASLKLTDAQRVVAREHGCPTWAKLRARVQASRGIGEAVDAFLAAVVDRDAARALEVVRAEPRAATSSLHVAAVLGRDAAVRQLIAHDPSHVQARIGPGGGDPLLWLCYSPFHGESPERDEGLAASARALLDAGADPNTRDERHGVPALHAVTGVNNAPPIARMLLRAGAATNDGESVFHAAERYHRESLELLLEYGVDLNFRGDWGNTPLYFLLRYWDVAANPRVKSGLLWLLDHGADPNVVCTREQRETSLHVAVRRGQHPDTVRLLLERGADARARDGNGRTAWVLAQRGGFIGLVTLLEEFGAAPEPLSPADTLMSACGLGDAETSRRLASPELVASLDPVDARLLPEAASQGRIRVVVACLEAGFDVDTTDEAGATALHHASIHGHADIVSELVRRSAHVGIHDREHSSTPLGWACFGADHVRDPDGRYEDTVRALLAAGAQPSPGGHPPVHAGVRDVLMRHLARSSPDES
jgi:ankyrin repeat protein